MKKRHIKYIHIYGVDNAAVLVADPTFVGYSIAVGAQCGAKIVQKVRTVSWPLCVLTWVQVFGWRSPSL